jgi:hypothetical protein
MWRVVGQIFHSFFFLFFFLSSFRGHQLPSISMSSHEEDDLERESREEEDVDSQDEDEVDADSQEDDEDGGGDEERTGHSHSHYPHRAFDDEEDNISLEDPEELLAQKVSSRVVLCLWHVRSPRPINFCLLPSPCIFFF